MRTGTGGTRIDGDFDPVSPPSLLSRTKVTRMYFFILHLSIADILTAFFTLLPEMIWEDDVEL